MLPAFQLASQAADIIGASDIVGDVRPTRRVRRRRGTRPAGARRRRARHRPAELILGLARDPRVPACSVHNEDPPVGRPTELRADLVRLVRVIRASRRWPRSRTGRAGSGASPFPLLRCVTTWAARLTEVGRSRWLRRSTALLEDHLGHAQGGGIVEGRLLPRSESFGLPSPLHERRSTLVSRSVSLCGTPPGSGSHVTSRNISPRGPSGT